MTLKSTVKPTAQTIVAALLALSLTLVSSLLGLGRVANAVVKPTIYQNSTTSDTPAADKIAPEVQSLIASLPAGEMITVIVTLKEQANLSAVTASNARSFRQTLIDTLQATAAAAQEPYQVIAASNKIAHIQPFWIFNGFSITATPDVIQQLASQPDVARITADDIDIILSKSDVNAEPNLTTINVPTLWASGRTGQGVVVASMDTGVDIEHPDLAASWRGGSNSWFDPYGQHPSIPDDLNGHGTATMGVIVGGESGGTAIGVAPGAKWIAVKIFNDQGSSTVTAIHQGFQWLLDPDNNSSTDDAPQVVNNSWTLSSPGCNLEFELDLEALQAANILPIFAAGNSGPNPSTGLSPANNPAAFAIGSTDNAGHIAADSSRGPSACGEASNTYPELAAPGVSIHTSALNGVFANVSGTSLAAPHVAGSLAILLSAFPDLTTAQQRSALQNSAQDLGVAGPDNLFGYGELDTLGAYQWLVAGGFIPQAVTPITVTTTSDTIANDAFCGLREAMVAAETDGPYAGCPSGGGADTIVFDSSLPAPVVIQLTTSGANEENALTGDLDISGTLTISSSGAIVIDGNGSDRVFDIKSGANVTIHGLTIRNGNVAVANDGGAIRVQGTLTLEDTTIQANQGGGINNLGGLLTLNNSLVISNTGGFGIYNQAQSALNVTGGAVSWNQGGGIYNTSATGTLSQLEVIGNSNSGIQNVGTSPTKLTLSGSTVLSNTAATGAGIYNEGTGTTVIIATSRIARNNASGSGGGIFNNGNMSVSQSTLDHNQAQAGGGINHFGGSLTLTNDTISSNDVSDNGGGIYLLSNVIATHVTFAFNGADGSGGNIFNDEGQLGIGSSLVVSPTAGDNCTNSDGNMNTVGYNLESANSCEFDAGTDLINTSPMLGELQNNGGSTWTHALLAGSPAINQIPSTVNGCGTSIVADQRGITRPQQSLCDIGAFEKINSGSLSINSLVDGNASDSDWQFSGSTLIGNFSLSGGGGSKSFVLPSGNYTVSEVTQEGYQTSVSCSNGESGVSEVSVTLAAEEAITCDFFNVQEPLSATLTITKVVQGALPATDWQFSGSGAIGDFTLPKEGGSKNFVIDAGVYTVTESGGDGYSSSVTCKNEEGGSTSVVVTLGSGEQSGCTFVNAEVSTAATLTITKEVIGDAPTSDWEFFGSGAIGSFTLPNVGGSQSFIIPSGLYTVTEFVQDGYRSSVICTNGQGGEESVGVDLASGESVSCRFTNVQTTIAATLIITKTVIGIAPAANWQFFGTGVISDFVLPKAGGSQIFVLPAGVYTVTETSHPDYESAAECTSDIATTQIANITSTVVVTLNVGEVARCTFTNTFIGASNAVSLPLIRKEDTPAKINSPNAAIDDRTHIYLPEMTK